jgi:hypothetical protein
VTAFSLVRWGELAAFRFDDLDGRVLTIERAVSGEEVRPTSGPSECGSLEHGESRLDLPSI